MTFKRIFLFLTALCLALPAGRAQPQDVAFKSLEAERLSQSGTAITIIFDDSGSMNEDNKMGQAKAAFTQWIEGIPAETKLSLITLNRGMLVPLEAGNKEAVKRAVATIRPDGGTPLTRTIDQAAAAIKERRDKVTPYERHIVVVFTDGQDSEYPGTEVTKALNRLSASTIESVGIGFHGQGDYMRGTATQYYNAGDTNELVHALKQVASEVDQQSDIDITPEIAALMEQQKSTAELAAMPAVAVEPAAPSPSSHSAPKSRNWIVIFFIVFVFFVIASSQKKKSRG